MEARRGIPPNFEQQFEHKQKLSFPQGSIALVDIKPEHVADETPIFYVPGWTEDYDTYKENLKLGYESGRRVISLKDVRDERVTTPSTFFAPGAEKRKALLLIQALEAKNIDTVDIIAHSEGAISALIAAYYYPRHFRNIVLDRPMGLVGRDNKLSLAARWLSNRKLEGQMRPRDPESPISAKNVAKRTIRYIKASPRLALAEVRGMTDFDGVNLMNILGLKGIAFSIIAGVDDKMAPSDRQVRQMKKVDWLPVEGYYPVTGTHNSISIHPETYGRLALNALDSLQYKRLHQETEPR